MDDKKTGWVGSVTKWVWMASLIEWSQTMTNLSDAKHCEDVQNPQNLEIAHLVVGMVSRNVCSRNGSTSIKNIYRIYT